MPVSLEDVEVALDIARGAGVISHDYFGSERVNTQAKGTADVVTDADFASEKYVTRRLQMEFPQDGIVGEEGANIGAKEERVWYIDPVDGTLNYSRGLPIWCISLSLFESEEPVLGVVHDPIRGETFWAAAGQGAWNGRERLSGSRIREAGDALVHVTVDFHEESQRRGLDDLIELAPRVLRTRNIGSAALALAWVAAGRFDAMVHRHASAWDYGAGVILIKEAGGIVTDLSGGPYRVDTRAVLAGSNPEIHEALAGVLGASGLVQ